MPIAQAPCTFPANLSLAGTWRFRTDPDRRGEASGWTHAELPGRLRVPGTTDEAGIGDPDNRVTTSLSRRHAFRGLAWYQRELDIPAAWAGKRIVLVLERTKPSRVWLDGIACGDRDSLCTPHRYDLSGHLTPGRHRLVIAIDNERLPPVGDPHQISDQTQTNWNGILGRCELVATDPVWIDEAVHAVLGDRRHARCTLTIGGDTSRICGTVRLRLVRDATGEASAEVVVPLEPGARQVVGELPLPPDLPVWDEFSPCVHTVVARLDGRSDSHAIADTHRSPLGICAYAQRDARLWANDRPLFLRGRHDACVFPDTGYAPMDVAAWEEQYAIAIAYGLNHYRFHTWCPPEAAFIAADRMGIYLQIELPNKAPYGDPVHDAWVLAEGRRVLREFGMHPSFMALSLGNEINTRRDILADIVRDLRAQDDRHLYLQGSNNFFANATLAAGDDFWVTMRIGRDGNVRGSFSHADFPLGHIQAAPPGTMTDYAAAIAGVPIPVVAHEVGQFQVHPDFREIDAYAGVLAPLGLQHYRDQLERRGLLGQAVDFQRATGALAALCYREEIEAALRTPGFAGFQLLDLQDFPGQGTALVGMLDAHMRSKDLITPEEWRRFCAPTVILARFERYVWSDDETFSATIEIAHHGALPLQSAGVTWELTTDAGRTIASGTLPARDIAVGELASVGRISCPLAAARTPRRAAFSLRIPGTDRQTSYPVWIFPRTTTVEVPPGIVLHRSYTHAARTQLAEGGTVVLVAEAGALPRRGTVEGFFAPDFWCYPMFKTWAQEARNSLAPGTLGILCDERHPALAEFPTAGHGEWHWWAILMHSRPCILDDLPLKLAPVVQLVDNVDRAHRLALVFEARVGRGRLLVCASDLLALQDRPEARQLLRSLLGYAAGPHFQPQAELTEEQIDGLLVR